MLTKKTNLLLLLIILIAVFLRFYRLPEMANFDFDQEYAANFAYFTINVFPVQLIGQPLSVPGLFMGPLYFYFLTPFFVIFGMHPIGGFVASALWGIITVVAYYYIGSRIFGRNAGLIAAFLRATLFYGLEYDWTMVPSYSSELLVIITWYCFYKFWKGHTKFLPLLSLVFGLYTSIHPILFPFYLIFIILLVFKRKIVSLKTSLVSLVFLLVPLSPLILFEYWHKFLEVKELFSLFALGQTTKSASLVHCLQIVLHSLKQMLALDIISDTVFSIIFFIIFIFLVVKKVGFWKDSFHPIMFLISLVTFLVYYTYFPTHVPEYYFLGITTVLFLYVSATLSLMLKNKFRSLFFLLLVMISFFNVKAINAKWQNPSLITLAHKDSIVKEIIKREQSNNDFYVSYIKEPGWDFGFDYLFKLYGQNLNGRIAKDNHVYTIVTPKSMSPDAINFSSGNIGLILPD